MFRDFFLQEGLLFRAAVWCSCGPWGFEFVDTLSKQISTGSSMVSRNKVSAHFMSEDIIGEKGTR